ncbi:unnamed protein product [Brassica oleracea]
MENKYSFKTSETTINDKLSSKYHVTTIKEIQSHTYIHNKESYANFGKPRKHILKPLTKPKHKRMKQNIQIEFHGSWSTQFISRKSMMMTWLIVMAN